MKNQMLLWLKWILWYPIMVFLCLEIAFLILGYRRYTNDDYSIKANPTNAFVGHPSLGIALNPGMFEITVNDSLKFKSHHLENKSREVVFRTRDTTDVLLLGCSFTYGFGVNDEATFASLLQKRHAELGIKNEGVIGYGTVQSLLQLKKAVEQDPPKTALLVFSSYHFMRNTLSPEYRSNLKTGYHRSAQNIENLMSEARFPYREGCTNQISLDAWDELYEVWPGRNWFASFNWFQTLRDRFAEKPGIQIEVTLCIIKEIQKICKENNIAFGLVCLDKDWRTEALHASLSEIPWLDIDFDFKKKEWVNEPYDSHPSPKGHAYIAEKIEPFLSKLIYED